MDDVALKARLTVTGEQGQGLGTLGSHDFASAGGIIGRSASCDWRLPDATNTLSARHAEIRFTGQGFTVVDLSTNGVYVNVTDAPLGRGNSALLVAGDLVYLGPYVISVDILRVPDQPAAIAPSRLPPLAASPPRPQAIARAPAMDPALRAPLDPLAALDGEDTLQESDNPFRDLGIGKRDRDRSDFGLRSDMPRRPGTPNPAPIPDFDMAPKPAPLPPPPPVVAPAVLPPVPPPVPPVAPPANPAEAVIPPDFLEELSALIPRLAEGQAAERAPPAPPPAPRAAPPAPPAPSSDDPEAMVTLLRMRGRAKLPGGGAAGPLPPLAPSPPPPGLVPLAGDSQAAFWSLFGLDPSHLSAEERDRVLGEVAGLLRSLVAGLMDLQATRRRVKSELSLDSTQIAGDENPFHTAASPEDALRRVFAAEGLLRRDAGAQAQAVFREIQVHELAVTDAMQATIARLMQRISPAAITFEAEGEGPGNGVFARRADKARLWDRYLIMHERLVDALDVLSPELVGQEFARAYAHHVQSMRGGQGS